MKYLLDTNTCIYYLNGKYPSIKVHFEKEENNIVLCAIVKAELYFGALKSKRKSETLSRIEQFVSSFYSFPFDDHASYVYGQIRSELEEFGKSIGPNDLIIAATAIANELILVTHNIKEFTRINNLELIDWVQTFS